jgi:hypothetical protein
MSATQWRSRIQLQLQQLLSRSLAQQYLLHSTFSVENYVEGSDRELVDTSFVEVPETLGQIKHRSLDFTERTHFDNIRIGVTISSIEEAHIESLVKNPETELYFTDGSYSGYSRTYPIERFGWAWAAFENRYADGEGRLSTSFIESYGGIAAIQEYLPSFNEELYSALNAELAAIFLALTHINSNPEHISTPILINYDNETARRFVTGEWEPRSRVPQLLAREARNLLANMNTARQTYQEITFGTLCSNKITANHIGFRWVRAHTNKSLGNAWVDDRAKAASDGWSTFRPRNEEEFMAPLLPACLCIPDPIAPSADQV